LSIANYNEMQTIYSFDLATGKFAMGSGEALAMPPPASSLEDDDMQESDIVILDGPPADKNEDAPSRVHGGKRKRGAFVDDELSAFTTMTIVVNDVA
jgi:hypothetical protein